MHGRIVVCLYKSTVSQEALDTTNMTPMRPASENAVVLLSSLPQYLRTHRRRLDKQVVLDC